MRPEHLEAAAQRLAKRQTTSTVGDRLPQDERPTTPEEGWHIQQRVTTLLNRPILGWKCGLPAPGRWVIAPVIRTMRSGQCLPAPAGPRGSPRIEPELAFELKTDLPAQPNQIITPEMVHAALGTVRLAVEVLGCRYTADAAAQASAPELLADHLWQHAVVCGPALEPACWSAASKANFPITLTVGDDHPGTVLTARHPDGDARQPLYWLAQFLCDQGMGLKAGQTVITGSLAGGALEVPFDTRIQLQYGEPCGQRGSLGSLSLELRQFTD